MTTGAVDPRQIPPDFPADIVGMKFLMRLLVFFGVAILIGAVGVGISFLVDPSGPEEGTGMVVLALFLIGAAVAAYLAMARLVEKRWPPFELAPKCAAGLLWGAGLGAALVLGCAAIIWAAGGIEIAGLRSAAEVDWLTGVLMTGLFAAVFEEILFRGVLFRLVEQRLGSWMAIASSALFFGVAHALAPKATVLSVVATVIEAGLLFAMVYLATRSLWWVMGLHGAWNFILGVVLGVPVSGNENEGLLITKQSGSTLLSGGDYGIEASLVTLAVLGVVAVVGLWRLHSAGLMVPPRWVRQQAAAES